MKHLNLIPLGVLFSSVICFAQTTHRSIHQEQSENYSKYNFNSEKEWDALRVQENGVPSKTEKTVSSQTCTLKKRVFGWNPYWSGSAYNNYQWSLLSDMSFFSYEVDVNTGNAVTTHSWATDASVTAALANGVHVNLCATLFTGHATFLASTTSKQAFITNMINLVQSRGANGCNIDFEGVPSAQSASFTAFMIDLCNQMHAANASYEVSIALPAVDWSAVYDVNAMKNYVDLFIIMGYDYYYNGSTTAGPTDPLYNFQTSYNYTLTKSITYYLNKNVPNAKLLLGLPYYGIEWATSASTIPSATTATGSSKLYNLVRNNTSGNYSNPLWDATSYSNYYSFNNGGQKQCFVNSDYSLGKRFDVVNEFGIGGIGIWALGYDDGYTSYWDKIKEKFSTCGTVACKDTIFDMGGPNRNYNDNEKYAFTIAPTGATSFSLAFSSFNTEVNADSLLIYNGPSTASSLIGAFTGTTSPGTVNSAGSALTLRVKSSGATNAAGWYAIWNCTAASTLDAGIPSVTTPNGTTCNTTFSPVVKIQNFGTTILTSCTINYHYDSNPNQTQSWAGSLATGASANVTLPSMTVAAGTHTFICSTSNPNGSTDGNTANDQSQTNFNVMSSSTLPLVEGFESSSNLPSGWTLWNPDNDAAWQVVTSIAHTGTNCIGFNNCLGNGSGNDMTGRKDRFITTPYDLSTATSAAMSFDVAYTTATITSKTYTDTLAIFSSIDCGSTWNQIYLKGGTNLATAATATVTQPCWSPTSTDWRTDNVTLNNLIGHSSVLFAFENRSDWGEWIYLDNINITAVTGIQETSDEIQFQVYPNPFSESTTIKFQNITSKISGVILYDVYGREVRTVNPELTTNGFVLERNDLPNGMYFLKVKAGDKEKVVKLVVDQ